MNVGDLVVSYHGNIYLVVRVTKDLVKILRPSGEEEWCQKRAFVKTITSE